MKLIYKTVVPTENRHRIVLPSNDFVDVVVTGK